MVLAEDDACKGLLRTSHSIQKQNPQRMVEAWKVGNFDRTLGHRNENYLVRRLAVLTGRRFPRRFARRARAAAAAEVELVDAITACRKWFAAVFESNEKPIHSCDLLIEVYIWRLDFLRPRKLVVVVVAAFAQTRVLQSVNHPTSPHSRSLFLTLTANATCFGKKNLKPTHTYLQSWLLLQYEPCCVYYFDGRL